MSTLLFLVPAFLVCVTLAVILTVLTFIPMVYIRRLENIPIRDRQREVIQEALSYIILYTVVLFMLMFRIV